MRVTSKKLRASANGQDCTVRLPGTCNFNPATTVLAHLPCGQKGMGMKGFDTVAVYACCDCHDVIDGRATGEVDWNDMPRSIAETHEALIRAGILTVKGGSMTAYEQFLIVIFIAIAIAIAIVIGVLCWIFIDRRRQRSVEEFERKRRARKAEVERLARKVQ